MKRIVALFLSLFLLVSPVAAQQGLLSNGQRVVLLSTLTITTAVTGITPTAALTGVPGTRSLIAEAVFAYGAGGTTADAYVQTSLDGGTTWVDIINFHFTTSIAKAISKIDLATALAAAYAPTDGSLASGTIKDGLLGDQYRVKVTTTGTYSGGSTLTVYARLVN